MLTLEKIHNCLQSLHDLLAEQREVVLGEELGQVVVLETVAQVIGQAHHLAEQRLLEQGEAGLCLRPTLLLH